jgi:hypothetical protein
MKNNLLRKKFLSCSFYLHRFSKYVSYGFPIINFYNPGVHYETPCTSKILFNQSINQSINISSCAIVGNKLICLIARKMYDIRGNILHMRLAYNFWLTSVVVEGFCTEKCELESLAFYSQTRLNETRSVCKLFQICDNITILFLHIKTTNP